MLLVLLACWLLSGVAGAVAWAVVLRKAELTLRALRISGENGVLLAIANQDVWFARIAWAAVTLNLSVVIAVFVLPTDFRTIYARAALTAAAVLFALLGLQQHRDSVRIDALIRRDALRPSRLEE